VTSTPAGAPLVTRGFVTLAAATLAFYVSAGIVLPVAPQFARLGLGADSLGFGVAIGAFSIAAVLLRPLVGWTSDRYGRRPLLLIGSVLTLLGLLLHLVAANLVVFVAARSLLGAGEGFFLVAALAAGSDLAPSERRGEALSFLSLSLYLGIAVGPPIGEALLGAGSYTAVWLAAAALAVVALGLSVLTPETAPVVTGEVVARGRTPLIHPAGLLPGIVVMLGLTGMAGFLAILPLYARQLGLDGAGLPLAVYGLVVIGLRVVGARLPDRVGPGKLSGAALLVSAVGLTIVGLVPTATGLLAGTVVFASGVAFIMPALLTLAVSRVPPEARGTVVGTVTLFLDVTFGIAPIGLSLVAGQWGYGATFLVSAGLAVAGSGVLAASRRRSLRAPAPVATA
jgi:MFS family permease